MSEQHPDPLDPQASDDRGPADGSPPVGPTAAEQPVAPPPPAIPPAAYPPSYPTFANGKPAIDESGAPVSPKSRLAAAILAWFLGFLGVHRFYVGKIGTGILMILTLGGLGVWVLIDFIMILVGSFSDKEGRRLYNW